MVGLLYEYVFDMYDISGLAGECFS